MLNRIFVFLVTSFLFVQTTVASPSDYPSKPISIVVAFPAGSGTDLATRIIAAEMEKTLKQQLVVVNRPGANGTIGANSVARADPDGYTLLATSNTPLAIAPAMMTGVPYDPVQDFTPIIKTGILPSVLITRPDTELTDVEKLVDYAKKNPNKLTYASGNGTGIVAGALFADRADIEMRHIPYQGTPRAITDIIGGQVDIIFSDLTAAMPFITGGRVNALAITTPDKFEKLPTLLTLEEQGFPGYDISAWNGIFGPKGLPDEITRKIHTAAVSALETASVKERLLELGFVATQSSPEEFKDFMAPEVERWAQLISASGYAPL